ncbi:PREDICTED: BRO1 domain-containing protein BROX-like [Ceratosolen solmsi marchali]|uniref:BRO1 domain-containing protein BROX-like n=1 Tax=Ceratosolen solmsi marchali TaxID=326594 RepID=A0AAJ7DWS1_9HYME|nr:PREDICTED: BRO1 domain-containing protein BROX-like [Ceratosolen solmsi marchali]XP_011499258.1 PREDICTED: BRO1 domain-containing protein BROX-like [Ceratosolen solmsi marchali]
MAHWFHRNLLKATTNHKFELKHNDPTDATRKLCSDLRTCRIRLLDLLKNPNNTSTSVEPAFISYLSLLYGFIWEVDALSEENEQIGGPNPSKLRNVFVFKWTHTLLGQGTVSFADSVYEAANISVILGLWFMKHAAMIASKNDITMSEAKEVYIMMRRAAGIFTFVQTEFLPQLSNPSPLGSDLDPRVINAYVNQCTAEAQEVTVARAVELKHKPSLISALANETSKLFFDAANTLRSFKAEISGQWIKYLEFKSKFYQSYSYNYCGEHLLAMDKCGDAIRALKESELCLIKAKTFCAEYSKIHGPAPRVKPDQHTVFKRLSPLVARTLDKCERENILIYHHSVPQEIPVLDTKATYGLVSPIDFHMPGCNSLWYLDIYKTLTGTETPKIDKEQDLPLVKEEEISQNNKEPKNESGCTLQ